jgi:nucleoside-diphosphate-sugar epimerase
MRVLFIGGTGTISSACSQLAVDRGLELYLLNRGHSDRPMPAGAEVLYGDIRDRASADQALGNRTFDVVVDWIAYTPDQVEADIERFRDRTGQYVFISSASAYQKPLASLPITESTVLHNPYWQYSRDKAACEARLLRAYREHGFPVTIVRPSHTYDRRSVPVQGGYTVIDRLRRGKPVIVHGDGTSLWVLTHHRDFAVGLVGLLGNAHAIGEAYHITSDELLTWNQIHEILARAAGAAPQFVHVPSDLIAAFDARWGAGLLGDKAYSVVFDNAKIKRLVPDFCPSIPFSQGAREIMAWYDAEPARQVVNKEFDQLTDRIIASYRAAWP